MALNLVSKYIWLIDTLKRHHRLTFEEINDLWTKSALSDGKTMPRRTFYNYRNGIADTFDIMIPCDKATFEYYIDDEGNEADAKMQQWLLDSMALNGMIRESHDVSSRIIVENVPSSRQNLPIVIEAMRANKRIKFSYLPYTRINPNPDVTIEPYFAKIFHQLWYVIGYNVKDKMIKTYALDRISNLAITADTFDMPADFDPNEFFKDCYGITTNADEPKKIRLKVVSTQAKYFRALPLHSSQREEIHDTYSIFEFNMRNTYDLRERILSHGSNIEVLEPKELRLQIKYELQKSLENYGSSK
jgi:predicted DNA-binding transcriptional regulator YafY